VAELHYLQGEQLKKEPGRLREAMASYEQAVRLRPSYAEARMALGVQLLAGGNYPGALSHFQAAQQLIPTQPAVHVNLGDAYRATQRWNDAQQAYRRALQLKPQLPEAHYGLALLFLTAGGDFPGLDELTAYEKAVDEFNTYRAEMGPRLSKDDQSEEYLRDLDRMIKRARRRAEREQGGAT
jgi:tetratricopeptide (TPR) repeat protein